MMAIDYFNCMAAGPQLKLAVDNCRNLGKELDSDVERGSSFISSKINWLKKKTYSFRHQAELGSGKIETKININATSSNEEDPDKFQAKNIEIEMIDNPFHQEKRKT